MSDKANSLIELAKLAASRHDERRKYEWKISLAFWGLLIAAIFKKNIFSTYSNCICIIIGAGIILVYAFLWLRSVWVANQNDKNESRYYIKQALSALKDENFKPLQPPEKIKTCSLEFWFGFLYDWAMLFHLVVTIVVVVIFFNFG